MASWHSLTQKAGIPVIQGLGFPQLETRQTLHSRHDRCRMLQKLLMKNHESSSEAAVGFPLASPSGLNPQWELWPFYIPVCQTLFIWLRFWKSGLCNIKGYSCVHVWNAESPYIILRTSSGVHVFPPLSYSKAGRLNQICLNTTVKQSMRDHIRSAQPTLPDYTLLFGHNWRWRCLYLIQTGWKACH